MSALGELVQALIKRGFPESTAVKIASGDLPMDHASRMARAREQGFDVDETLYHGSTHDITAFDGSRTNAENDMGRGIYLTDDIEDAGRNYAGEGPDLTNRIELEKERLEWDHPDASESELYDMARKKLKGSHEGAVYPVHINRSGLASSSDELAPDTDYMADAAAEFGVDPDAIYDQADDVVDEITERAYELEADDYDSPVAIVQQTLNEQGAEGVYPTPEWRMGELRDNLDGVEVYDDDGLPIGGGRSLAQMLQDMGHKGYVDYDAASRFDNMGAGTHTIMFPGSESQIRSVNAAFDPDNVGLNHLLGAADPRLLGATAAGTFGAMRGKSFLDDHFQARDHGELLAAENPQLIELAQALMKVDTPIGNPLEGVADLLMHLGQVGLDGRNENSMVQRRDIGETAKRFGFAGLDLL